MRPAPIRSAINPPTHQITPSILGGDFNWPLSGDMELTAHVDAQFIGPTWFHTVQGGQRPHHLYALV